MPKYKATEYVRLSYTDDKSSESDSVTNQKMLIDDFVKNNPDIEVVSVKVDDGFSGVLFDRPAFLEMMEDIKAGTINCVIVKDLSRLGREYIETGRYLRRIFPSFGVRFIAINDNIDTLNESCDELGVSLKNLLNDAYSHDISKKTRCALETKRQNGDYVGACTIYGYQKDEDNKNRLVIDEIAARTVQDIFRMKINGVSAKKIADELNHLGVLSPIEYKKSKGLPHPTGGFADKEGAKWSVTTIVRILKDETYTGTLIQGRQGTYNHKLKTLIDNPADQWVRTENAHDPIIRKHDFDLVQKILRLDTRTTPGGEKVHLFSGILICGCCGARMTRKSVPYKGEKYFYYYCPTGKKHGCKEPVMLKEQALIDCVLCSVRAHIDSVVSLEQMVNDLSVQRVSRTLVQKYVGQIRDNEARLQEIRGFKSRLYEDFVNGILNNDEYKRYKDDYDSEATIMDTAIASLKQELEDVKNNTSERLRWMEHFKRFSTMTELDRLAVIQLVHSIKVKAKKELQITFRYQSEFDKANRLMGNQKEAV